MNINGYQFLQSTLEILEVLRIEHPEMPEHVLLDRALEIARLELSGWVTNLKTLEIERKIPSASQDVAGFN